MKKKKKKEKQTLVYHFFWFFIYLFAHSDGEVPAILELWGMRSTPSLPSLPGSLWPVSVAPDKGPIYSLNRTKSFFFHYTDFWI